MALTRSKLSLDPDGDNFVLRRVEASGTTTTMKLSETDVLTLGQSVPALQQLVLSRRKPRGGSHTAVSATEVSQVALHSERTGQATLITMIAPGGAHVTFALPRHVVESLVEQLPVLLTRMIAANPTKQ
jgi:hypothetical protein